MCEVEHNIIVKFFSTSAFLNLDQQLVTYSQSIKGWNLLLPSNNTNYTLVEWFDTIRYDTLMYIFEGSALDEVYNLPFQFIAFGIVQQTSIHAKQPHLRPIWMRFSELCQLILGQKKNNNNNFKTISSLKLSGRKNCSGRQSSEIPAQN